MNVNFGLFPPIAGRSRKADRKLLYTDRAREALQEWQARSSPFPSSPRKRGSSFGAFPRQTGFPLSRE